MNRNIASQVPPIRTDLRALLAPLPAGIAELQIPGPAAACAVIRPVSPEATAQVVTLLHRGQVSWTIGPVQPGCEPRRPVVLLDLSRLTRVDPVQPQSGLVTAGVGVRPETLVRLLRGEGFQIEPLSRKYLLGPCLAGRHGRWAYPGQEGAALADRVVALRAVLPDGNLLRTPLAPRRATGPDLAALLLGSQGQLGALVEVTLRATRQPGQISELAFSHSDQDAARRTLQRLERAKLPCTALARSETLVGLRLEGLPALVLAAGNVAQRLASLEQARLTSLPEELLEPRLPPARPPSPEVAILTTRLRQILDPAGLLLTQDEAMAPVPLAAFGEDGIPRCFRPPEDLLTYM